MRLLLTSPRAPVTLDLARRFHARGEEVFLCDSLRLGCARFSRCHQGMFHTPQPRQSPERYIDAINDIVQKHTIDLVVPTCEEVFYLARFREEIECEVFVDTLEKLNAIHNKWTFSQSAGNEAAEVPESFELRCPNDIEPFRANSADFVFKPQYSRFASETLVGPKPHQLDKLSFSNNKHWIAQQRIVGTEISTYSVAHSGVLTANCCYQSFYRAGRGSGIYFRSVQMPKILEFVNSFVTATKYTGQIGFDCIVDENGIPWVIEGNPRATSGLHMFSDESSICESILSKNRSLIEADLDQPAMIGAAMPVWGVPQAIRKWKMGQFIRDMLQGRDVLFRWNDVLPALALPVTMLEIAWLAVSRGESLQQAATHDIEWNGETI